MFTIEVSFLPCHQYPDQEADILSRLAHTEVIPSYCHLGGHSPLRFEVVTVTFGAPKWSPIPDPNASKGLFPMCMLKGGCIAVDITEVAFALLI